MTAGLTILIPHKSTPLNDASLDMNLRMLRENTVSSNYDVCIMSESRDPYVLWNEYAQRAKHDHIVLCRKPLDLS